MGKKKKEKVIDLKPEKISDEQLQKVQQIINMMNRGQMDLGIIETRKHKLLHDISSIQEQLTAMQGEFEKEYGTYDINIQDGTINYKKDEPSDS
jgi:hypothetical protein